MRLANRKARHEFARLADAIAPRMTDRPDFLRGPEIEFTIDESDSLFMQGEEIIAFEILISNLHEFRFPLTAELYAAISRVGVGLGMPPEQWSILAESVSDP